MTQEQPKKRRKWLALLRVIFLAGCLVMVINGVRKHAVYNAYYDQPPETVFAQHAEEQQFLWNATDHIQGAQAESLESHLMLFSGNTELGEITVRDGGEVRISPRLRGGQVKAVLLDAQGKIAFSGELTGPDHIVSVMPGEYRAAVIGKWFTGNVLFRTSEPKAL